MFPDTYTIPPENETPAEALIGNESTSAGLDWIDNFVKESKRNPEQMARQALSELTGNEPSPRYERAEQIGGSALQQASRTLGTRSFDSSEFTSESERTRQAEQDRKLELQAEQAKSAKKIMIIGRAISYTRQKETEASL